MANTTYIVKRVGSHHWAVMLEGQADDRWHPIYPTKREALKCAADFQSRIAPALKTRTIWADGQLVTEVVR